MKDNIIMICGLLLVLAIGVVCFVNTDSYTGAQVLSSMYCKCKWVITPPYGYVGSMYEDMPPIESYIRVSDPLQQTNCYTYCLSHGHRDLVLVEALPVGLPGQEPVSLKRFEY